MSVEQEPKIFDANLADLIPTTKNPRQLSKKGDEQLKKKMDKYPKFITAREVVIDEDFNILGGHQRVKVAQKRGDKTIRVKQVFGWTQEEKDNFIISDNVSEGDWDADILANEWDEEVLSEWMGDELNFNEIDFGDIESNADRQVEKKPIKVVCPDCGKEFEV